MSTTIVTYHNAFIVFEGAVAFVSVARHVDFEVLAEELRETAVAADDKAHRVLLDDELALGLDLVLGDGFLIRVELASRDYSCLLDVVNRLRELLHCLVHSHARNRYVLRSPLDLHRTQVHADDWLIYYDVCA